jgi:carbamoyl-phosphate synthase small subunit
MYFPTEFMKKATLVIEDGTVFEGLSFGSEGEAYGEVVFNTSITGYQEILTDPSYNGQIVAMTYPEIGNYGVNPEDVESRKPFLRGFVVKEYWKEPSNWRSRGSLGKYLSDNGVVGIEGVDTRSLTKLIRSKGAQKAVISTTESNPEKLLRKVRHWDRV